MLNAAVPLPRGTRDTFWRSLQTFGITRIVITVLLLLYLTYNPGKEARTLAVALGWELGAIYLAAALGFALVSLYVRQHFMAQLLAQLTVDIAMITKLYVTAGGASSGMAILYLFPLAGCAILAPLVLALFTVSVVTLILLGESGYQMLRSAGAASTSQAGLYGAAFFAAAYMVNRLAAHLIRQEDLAAKRGRELHLQEAINRLVVADMNEGVLVVGPKTEVMTGNPAAARMLGQPTLHTGFRLREHAGLAPIVQALKSWKSGFPDSGQVDGSCFVMVKSEPASGSSDEAHGPQYPLAAHLKLRFMKVETGEPNEERSVIFMRDVSEIENQAQQLKLASMGRLTASIAHEVRNPLSAISHAASLLREDVVDPTHARLLAIVTENALRLDRMIEDILKLSRKAQVHDKPLQLGDVLDGIVSEFCAAQSLDPSVVSIEDMRGYRVHFDPLHLREIVVNLLSNAMRYASGGPGSIRVRARRPRKGRFEIHVQDDGTPITPQVRAHLFEPFYTTSSKGTGLGLYVARELCLNNGAMLDYEYRSDPGSAEPTGRFVITFAN
ncbi:MAG TPA: HAMP domain-containing sensor histidine kinase [Noviherbaspirillum sp.]|nr:HAMP domain-containing sensor histidine kinase [Noviherbaspirillum sp.]